MSFIHMETLDTAISECAKDPDPAYPENDFLAEPVILISAIKKIGQRSVPFEIFGQVRIKKVDGYLEASDACDFISPGTNLDGSAVYRNGSPLRHLPQMILDNPFHGFFRLRSVGTDSLVEVTLARKKR